MINTAASVAGTDRLTMSAFRYSNDPGRVGEFLELIGLSRVVSNGDNSWLVLQSASGAVSVHSTGAAANAHAHNGSTDLVIITQDVTALAAAIEAAEGAAVDVWDESFGRQAILTFAGHRITINEEQNDPYGYHTQKAQPKPVTVAVHWRTTDLDGTRALLGLLGFRAEPVDTGNSLRLTGPSDTAGVVYLHPSDETGRYELALETEEPLDQLSDRLRDNGFRPRSSHPGSLQVEDPDGCQIMITNTPAR